MERDRHVNKQPGGGGGGGGGTRSNRPHHNTPLRSNNSSPVFCQHQVKGYLKPFLSAVVGKVLSVLQDAPKS